MRMIAKACFFIGCFTSLGCLMAQNQKALALSNSDVNYTSFKTRSQPTQKAQETIHWIAANRIGALPSDRKFMVFVYSDFCTWCKQMDEEAFKDPCLANYINENFIPIKLNSSQKENIKIGNKTYSFDASGQHSLAIMLTEGRLTFPSIAFLDKDFNLIQSIGQYQEPESLEAMACFFLEDHYQMVPWERFKRGYKIKHVCPKKKSSKKD
jgi:thioredoxin-related protein